MRTAAGKPVGETSVRRDTTINLRLPLKTRDLIDEAAALAGKSRTDFVVESAKQHATDVLLDQRLFELEDDQWDAFVHALEDPPMPNTQLRKLLARKPPWEK